ncbi:MAG TPA: hypothetical protein VK009_05070 [Chloroflexota bacterium]|nr:hypothetical protein [Chloroflexota bacterium]
MNAFVASRFFLSSYAPLFVLLALRFDCWYERGPCLGLGVLSAVDLLWMLRDARRIQPTPYRISSIKDRGSDVAGYLATYLLPFLVVGLPTLADVAAYVLFLVVTGIVYVKSDMIHINPLLYLLGYRSAEVATDNGLAGFLIARDLPSGGDNIRAARVRGNVLVRMA